MGGDYADNYNDYFGDFTPIEQENNSTCWGCNDCGGLYWSLGGEELRWCPNCQEDIWEDGMDNYRKLRAEARRLKIRGY